MSVRWLFLFVSFLAATAAYAQNPIQTENLKTGTTDWQLGNPALNHEIEGYASLTSVNRGGQINLYVNTTDPTFTIDIFRMGWYGLAGGRRVMSTITLSGITQPACPQDSTTGMTECTWTNPYVLNVPGSTSDPTNWASGIYLAKLTGQLSGKQSYIVFVVRDDSRPSKFLFVQNVTTYQAYNYWGGRSLYTFNSTPASAQKVSFNRPYAPGPQAGAGYGVGAGEFLTAYAPNGETYPAGWEYNAVRWLERQGYDVTYATSLDLHEQPNLLLSHAAYLSIGHNEYWSTEMRTNVTNARDNGVNLGFFGANTSYWRIRFETSPATGQVDRTEVCYKIPTDPVTDPIQTVRWRDLSPPQPEASLIGVQYQYDPVQADIVVQNTSNWVFQDTGLKDGDHLTGLLGYEVDALDSSSPANTIPLGNSPYTTTSGSTQFSNMSVYTAASGATVFSTGSIQWSWALDDYNSTALRPSFLNAAAQQITSNVLAKFGATQVSFTTIQVHAGGAAYTDSQGSVWSADTGFTGGSTASTTAAISNTSDQPLYQSERYGAFSYNFTVPAGSYSVTLKFAEIYFSASGQRIFSVAINGATVLSNFDIVAQAGGANTAIDKTFTVNAASSGSITIQFITGSADLPKVSAIQIKGVASAPDFSISASPASQTAVQGSGTTYTTTVTASNGFSSAVALSVSGLPTGAKGTFSPTSITGAGSSTLSVSTAATTPAGSYTLTITGTSGSLVHSTTVTLLVSAASGGSTTIQVHAGGAAYTDSQGSVWSADTGFTGGSTASTTAAISNTSDQPLYQSERYGAFSYNFTVPAGSYSVTLKFAEIYFSASGQRIFSVAINGATVLSNFDIVAQAGGANTAIDKTFTVNAASSGSITIQFITGSADLPKVSAIQIKGVASSAPVITTNPTSQTVTAGATATFTAAASGTPAATVQWQVSTDGGATFSNVTGATSATLSFATTAAQNGNQYKAVFTNAAGNATTTAATLTVNSAPVITTNPTSQTVTAGATATFTAAASGTPTPTVQWQVSTNGGATFSNVTGATSATLSFATTAAQNGNQYKAVFTNAAGNATTTAATLTVNSAPVITTNPTSQTVTAGATATFTAAASGAPAPTVQWQVSTNGGATFSNVTGATSTTLSFATTAAQNGNQYKAVFTNAAGNATTTAATLTVNSVPVITTNPTSQTVTAGATATFTAAASGAPAATVQWQVSTDGGVTFNNVAGATSTTLSFATTAVQNGNQYKAVFTNTLGTATTTAATLTVNSAPVITTNPTSQTVTAGATATFTAAASGAPAATVQWQVSTNGGVTFNNVAGATSATLSFATTAAQNGNQYKAVFTNAAGNATTTAATLTVNSVPVITTNPTSQTVTAGATATFTAAASGAPAATVQWQVSTDGGVTFNNVAGATSTTLSFATTAVQNGNQYKAVFTNTLGTATTTAATLTVNSAPVITTNPTSQTVTAGATATFTAAASGAPAATVQWQVSTNGGVTFNNVAGATSATLSFATTAAQNGNQYKAVFTNAAGNATTMAATLTVNSVPVITTNPTSQTVTAGATATFTAAVSGAPAATVQWQVSTDGGVTFNNVAGATSTTLSFATTAVQNGNQYKAVFTNTLGTATTTAATLTVNTTQSFWTTSSTPANVTAPDSNSVELGLKFSSNVAGHVVGARVYCATNSSGTHTVHLWSSAGASLATATLPACSGWTTVNFSSPVAIAANTTYTISYHTIGYAWNHSFFTSAITAGNLTAPINAGVYVYGSSPAYPTTVYLSANYWIDVLFTTP